MKKKENTWRYHVRVIGPAGETIYGLFREPFGKERKPKRGYAFVEEAITGQTYEVHESRITDLPTDFGGEYDKFVEGEREIAQQHSDSLPTGIRPGKLFTTGVGDGYAFYLVTKVTKKTATIDWRGFSLDRYADQVLGGGGTFPLECIEPLVRRCESIKKLFSKTPMAKEMAKKAGKRKVAT